MKDILLHPKTAQAIDRLVASKAHALLLTGDLGAGKATVARSIAEQLLGESFLTAPYGFNIEPSSKAVGIEQIRELQKFLQLKTAGKADVRRVAVINQADSMTVEAQNALLKILEEPPEDTVIVLTASKPHQLRPTIHSRVQTVTILQPTKSEIIPFFKDKGFSETDVNKAYMLSNGQVGLMTALLDDSTENTLVSQIDIAKQLYGMSAFERLTKVDELSKDRDAIADLFFACKRICMTALEQAALKSQKKGVESWHKQLSLIIEAEELLKYTPNTKLLLTDLFISI